MATLSTKSEIARESSIFPTTQILIPKFKTTPLITEAPVLSSHFIKYAIAAKAHPSIHLIEWGHGPVHIFGGVELSFDTAQSGAYWRPQALLAAELIISACGGAVADYNGTVRVVVPPEWAVEVHAKLAALAVQRTGHYDGAANELVLVSAGVGKLTPTRDHQGKLRLSMEPIEPRTVQVRSIEVTEGDDGRASVTAWTDKTSVTVRVPLEWASSDKQQWHTTAQVDHDVAPSYDKDADYDDPEDV